MSFLSGIFKKSSVKKSPEKFTIHGVNTCISPDEIPFAEALFSSPVSIPTGRKAIEDMKKYKVDFVSEENSGTVGGYFAPENNKIVMAKSAGMNFMEFALVHEARHLLQDNQGRKEIEKQNPDYASRLMINRAAEADAQTQAPKNGKHREHDAPMKRFEEAYKPIVDRFNQSQSLSDAFKGWYDDENNCAAYELGDDIKSSVRSLFREPDTRPYISLKPADIAKFYGADRVDGFDEFLNSKQARQVHLLTKTVVEMYDIAARGASPDVSLNTVPVRDLHGNPSAQICAAQNMKETREIVEICIPLNPQKVPFPDPFYALLMR